MIIEKSRNRIVNSLDSVYVLVYYFTGTLKQGGTMTEFDRKIPIYIQILNSIKQDIVSGNLKQGEKLYSVREYAETLAVNPNTVQRAYQELEREGITETRRGMGSFISEKESLVSELQNEMAESVLDSFIQGMSALGFSHGEIIDSVTKKLRNAK
jgi:DNA-binding transcriptional regulator YhcF (GntR family)